MFVAPNDLDLLTRLFAHSEICQCRQLRFSDLNRRLSFQTCQVRRVFAFDLGRCAVFAFLLVKALDVLGLHFSLRLSLLGDDKPSVLLF